MSIKIELLGDIAPCTILNGELLVPKGLDWEARMNCLSKSVKSNVAYYYHLFG